MSIDAWIALAFAFGLVCAVAYYKGFRWGGCGTLFALPVAIVALLGWPNFDHFEDTSVLSVVAWLVPAFFGVAVGVGAIVLKVVK
jgi:hypothetical protein